jgi:vacuolar-type H+-ATPase subunit I/STV1
MQLDSSIDQRLRELEDINREIQQNRDVSDQEEQMTQQNYYELLATKMDKSKILYQTIAYQIQTKQFNDVATGRYRQVYQDENEARGALDQCRSKNMMIEEVLDKIRNENPDLDVFLNKCIGW